MIGDDLDTPPLKYSPIRYLGLPLFVRILPYFLSSCRPEHRWRNWLLACAHVGLVDVGGVGAGQRFAVHVPPEKEPTPIKYDSSSEQMWRRPLGAPPPRPPRLRVPSLVGTAWTVPAGRRAAYWLLSYWPSLR